MRLWHRLPLESPRVTKPGTPEMRVRPRVGPNHIRDPLWGDVYLFDEETRLIDSDLFQRQRGVKQLGTAMLVYPSAVQTRFVHALGNLHLIDQMLLAAADNADEGTLRGFFRSEERRVGKECIVRGSRQ